MPSQFIFARSWELPSPVALEALARRVADERRLNVDVVNDRELVLRGGSQLKTRLLGGWFVSPDSLPRCVQMTVASLPGGSASLEVRVEDVLGPAFRDGLFGRRYERAANLVFESVDAGLAS